MREGLPESWQEVFYHTRITCFLLPCAATLRLLVALQRLQRATGVIYMPNTKRPSHYFDSRLALQFDAVIPIDVTSAM